MLWGLFRNASAFFIFQHENVCCGFSLELSHWGASNEYDICFREGIWKKFMLIPPLIWRHELNQRKFIKPQYKPLRFLTKSSNFILRSCLMLALWRSVFNMMIANASRRTVSGFLKFFTWSGLQSIYRSAKTCQNINTMFSFYHLCSINILHVGQKF